MSRVAGNIFQLNLWGALECVDPSKLVQQENAQLNVIEERGEIKER
jgi:hypothetical protein